MGSSKRKKQSRLAFTPLPSSSLASSSYNTQVRDRAAAVTIQGGYLSAAKRRKVKDGPNEASLSERPASIAAAPSNLPQTPDLTASRTPEPEVISEEDEEPFKPSQRMSSRKKMKQKKLHFDSSPSIPSASRQSLNMAPPVRVHSSRSSQPTPKAGFFGTQYRITVDSSDEEGDGSEGSVKKSPSPPKRSSKRKRSRTPPEEMPSIAVDRDDEDDEDEVMPTTPAARRRRRRLHKLSPEAEATASSPPLSVDDDEEDSDVVVTGSRTRGKRKAVSRSSDEASPAEEAPRARKRLRRLNPVTEEVKRDLEEDLRDLASSGSDTEIRPSQNKKKNDRQEALARLKRKRDRAVVEISDDEASQGDQDVYDDDDNYDEEPTLMSDEEAEEATIILPPRLARHDMFNADEEDDSFIVDDEEGHSGMPGNVPIEFTRFASMKAKDLFRYAIEWMVQKKINPAFQMHDEIYNLAFKKLDDEVKGLAGSKFTSSAWTSEFTCTLEARPEMEFGKIDRSSAAHFLRDRCDACNRSGHPATYEVRFQGRPYHHITLEPVAHSRNSDSSSSDSESQSEDEAEDEADERLDKDARGRAIAPMQKVFYLGKFCMSNAETAHSLHHWRYHLYEWVVEYLNMVGYNSPNKIVKRDGWSTRKRQKYANKIVDAMQTDGKIKALYRDFKGQVDTARDSKQGRFGSSP